MKLATGGGVKILDFGLAKAFPGAAGAAGPDSGSPTRSPTVTQATAHGVVLGTAAYMSPEQARGRPVDRRTDVWAFGCCLYEALAGKRAFTGETAADVTAAIVGGQVHWDGLPEATPRDLHRLLRRCLEKDPERRLRDIADARLDLEDALEASSDAVAGAGRATAGRAGLWRPVSAVAGVVLGALLTAAAFWQFGDRPLEGERPHRLQVAIPPSTAIALDDRPPMTISPEGSRIVFVGHAGDSTRLFVRDLDDFEIRELPDTEGASGPFFSPDGRSIAYFSGLELRRVSPTGGTSHVIGGAPPVTRGAAWSPRDEVLLTPTKAHGLARIDFAEPETGSPLVKSVDPDVSARLTVPAAEREEKNHSWPQVLPRDGTVLVTVMKVGRDSYDDADIAVIDLESGSLKTVVQGGYHARYVPTGHLLYMSSGVLMAAPFSLSELEVTGSPAPVLRGVMSDPLSGAAYFAVSRTGTLAYVPGGVLDRHARRVVWVERDGTVAPLMDDARPFASPRLSPDGSRLAVAIEEASDEIWIYDLDRRTLSRFTFEARNVAPLWTPDGDRLVFSSTRTGFPNLMIQPLEGGGPELLFDYPTACFATGFTPDGRTLAFVAGTGNLDAFVHPLDGSGAPEPLLDSRFQETGVTFSPDGEWLAYASDESGRSEIYVRFRSGSGGKTRISVEGGTEPVWAGNGELFYRSGPRMMAVRVATGDELEVGPRQVLFERELARSPVPGVANYDVTADGRRFVVVEPEAAPERPTRIHVVVDWFDELRRLVAPESSRGR